MNFPKVGQTSYQNVQLINSKKMKQNKETILKFTVSLEEANKIFKALGKEPFNEVYELIGSLNEQANQQLSKESFQITRNDSKRKTEQLTERKQN
jgi:hypothetical protein